MLQRLNDIILAQGLGIESDLEGCNLNTAYPNHLSDQQVFYPHHLSLFQGILGRKTLMFYGNFRDENHWVEEWICDITQLQVEL